MAKQVQVIWNDTVTDDSGFLGLVDPDAYESFVDEDWTFEQLMDHFGQQMKAHTLLLWGTGCEMVWKVRVISGGNEINGHRAITGPIASSKGRLCVINYESLTMAAQFKDVKIPEPHMADCEFHIEPGAYAARVVQIANPDDLQVPDSDQEFVIELIKGGQAKDWKEVPWHE